MDTPIATTPPLSPVALVEATLERCPRDAHVHAAPLISLARTLAVQLQVEQQKNLDHAEDWAMCGMPRASLQTKALVAVDAQRKAEAELGELKARLAAKTLPGGDLTLFHSGDPAKDAVALLDCAYDAMEAWKAEGPYNQKLRQAWLARARDLGAIPSP